MSYPDYHTEFALSIEKAIRFKFPKIKNLVVTMGKDDQTTISFDEDGALEQEVIEYMAELKKEGLKSC